MASLSQKIRAQIRDLGPRDALLYAAARAAAAGTAGRVRIVKYVFVAQPIPPAEAEAPAAARASFSFVRPTSADWPGFLEVERPASVLAVRFAQGARCVAALNKDGQLAGFAWYTLGAYEEDEVRARFVPAPAGRSAWDFDVMVMPRYRMGRLFGQLWRETGADLRQHGVTHTISRISAFNAASLTSHRRLGARLVGQALFVRAGPLQWMRSTVPPHWHMSRQVDDRPRLDVGTAG